MSLFKKMFGGKKETKSPPKKSKKEQSSAVLKIKQIERLTPDAVKVIFDVPEEVKAKFTYTPGQYVNLNLNLEGEKVTRSYSICSDVKEPLAIGIKKVEKGLVSSYFNDKAKEGDE